MSHWDAATSGAGGGGEGTYSHRLGSLLQLETCQDLVYHLAPGTLGFLSRESFILWASERVVSDTAMTLDAGKAGLPQPIALSDSKEKATRRLDRGAVAPGQRRKCSPTHGEEKHPDRVVLLLVDSGLLGSEPLYVTVCGRASRGCEYPVSVKVCPFPPVVMPSTSNTMI